MGALTVFQEALSDKRFASQWNAARYDKGLKLAVERRYAEAIIMANDQLRGCTPESVKLALLDQSAAGLSLSKSLGLAYLIPYKDQCTFSPGYRGLVHLALRGRTVLSVQANLVHKLDPKFRVWADENGRHIEHEETRDLNRGEVTHSYCIARFASGGYHIEVMDAATLALVEAQAKSRPKGGAVWNSSWKPEMQKKAVTRRAAKFWPLDPEGHLAHALSIVDQHDPVDFDRTPTAEGGELLISDVQQIQLHAAITDRGIEDKRASEWLLKKAQALGYASMAQLPASQFETVREALVTRAAEFLQRGASQ